MSQNPTAWFDQFPPAPDWPADSQWCARHWAPCPGFGANGILATIMVMQRAVTDLIFAEAVEAGPEAMNQAMHDAGRLCCSLGDEVMYEIWGQCPPSGPAPSGASRGEGE